LAISASPTAGGFVVVLTWNVPAAGFPDAYVIEAGSQPGASDLVTVDTRSLDTSLNGTAPPGTYYVRVRGRNACGLGSPSNEVQLVLR
jgi:hypothetical protein